MAKTEIHPDPVLVLVLTPRQCHHGAIGNLIVREVADGEICCGSAGLDNLEQPQIAERLDQSKAKRSPLPAPAVFR
jgi:hypothetical protein